MLDQGRKAHRVPRGTQSRDRPEGNARDEAAMPEGFSSMHIGQMHLDHRQTAGRQSITERHAGMGESSWVDEDAVDPTHRGLHDINQHALVIALLDLQ